uniref:Uncharacterized protein n=1 Tax=Magnetococcus massalia (strain MO-1) TaxID=451514 RepID=A0A1S7LMM4_MAGMO|nr:Protein of unknown function [Candidatus Magnetococcus massalia]
MISALCLALLLCVTAWPSISWALSAKLLPEGVWRVRLYQNEVEADHWRTSAGDRQPMGQVGLDTLASNGITSTAGVYSLENSAKYRLHRTDLSLDYGIHDDLTVGLWLPYFDKSLQQQTTLTQGAAWGALTGVQQATIAGAASSLNETEPARGDFGDLYLGFKHRVVGGNKDRFRFALGGGVRMPTGHVADPLNSKDASTGDGQWDLSLWSWTDYQFTDHFFVNLRTYHDYGLAAHKLAAHSNDSSQASRMKFQPGVLHNIQLEPQVRIPFKKWELLPSLRLTYDYQESEKRQRFDTTQAIYSGAMVETDGTSWQRLMIKPTLGFKVNTFKFPLFFYLAYGQTLHAKNSADIRTVELRMDLFLKGK